MLSLQEASHAIGAGVQTVRDWQRLNLVHTIRTAGRRTKLDRTSLLVATVIQGLRTQGLSLAAIRPIVEFLSAQQEVGVRTAISGGRTILAHDGKSVPQFVAEVNDYPIPDGDAHVLVFVDIGESLSRVDRYFAAPKARPALAMSG